MGQALSIARWLKHSPPFQASSSQGVTFLVEVVCVAVSNRRQRPSPQPRAASPWGVQNMAFSAHGPGTIQALTNSSCHLLL